MTNVERIFELPLHGVDIPMPFLTIDVPEFQLTAELQAGAPFRLKVHHTRNGFTVTILSPLSVLGAILYG